MHLNILEFMYTKATDPIGPPISAERAAYEYLLGEIFAGRLQGGCGIRQEEIAERLSLSRIPVRDAIRHLVGEGFLTLESNRRVTVTLLEANDLLELFQMREVLEGLAARHAAKHITDQDIEHLTWLAERMDQDESAGDRWLPAHEEFHEFLCSRARMPRLAKEITRLRRRLQPQVRMLIEMNGVAELAGSSHLDLVDKIKERDPERAEKAIREHIVHAARDIIKAVDKSIKTRRSFSGIAGTAKSKNLVGKPGTITRKGFPRNMHPGG